MLSTKLGTWDFGNSKRGQTALFILYLSELWAYINFCLKRRKQGTGNKTHFLQSNKSDCIILGEFSPDENLPVRRHVLSPSFWKPHFLAPPS